VKLGPAQCRTVDFATRLESPQVPRLGRSSPNLEPGTVCVYVIPARETARTLVGRSGPALEPRDGGCLVVLNLTQYIYEVSPGYS